jgi:aldose 1-epimerase
VRAPTGNQYPLTFGASSAIITEVAAGLRALVLDGVEVIQSYPEHSMPPMSAGIVLVPWPNRVAAGTWALDGVPQLLDVTERATGNASHGLLRNSPYRLVDSSASHVTLSAGIHPQHGYPFLLDTAVRYELSAGGLRVTHTITNLSERTAPVAVGAHPYLKLGDVPIETVTLALSATTYFEVDAAMIPTGELPVEGTDFDLRGGRVIADLLLDHGFGGVVPGAASGESVHSLTAPDGQRVELFADDSFGFVQAFTPRNFPGSEGPITAVAIEPMTGPANSFNTGLGLRWLEPGETWSLTWGIRYVSRVSG